MIRGWDLICATRSICRLLAICLLFSEAMFAGHSGYWHGPTLCRDAAGTRSLCPGEAGLSSPRPPSTDPRPLAPRLPADAKFPVNFCSDSVASPSFDHHFLSQEMTWKTEESSCAKIKVNSVNLSLTGKRRFHRFLWRQSEAGGNGTILQTHSKHVQIHRKLRYCSY